MDGVTGGVMDGVTARRTLPGPRPYSTVTVLARLRGWSTFSPLMPAMW